MRGVRIGLPMFPMLTLANSLEEARQYYAAYGSIEEEREGSFSVRNIPDSGDLFVWETDLPDDTPYEEEFDPTSGVTLRIVDEE